MISRAFITEWRNIMPWMSDAQVEQDLIISRAIIEIFSEPYLYNQLAFRGGTALHKLFYKSQARYSEDIDLVQVQAGAIGPAFDLIKKKLSFLGIPSFIQKQRNNTLVYKFESQ